MTSSTYDDKFYKDISNSSYNSAKIYLNYLWQYLQPLSVLDVGCGKGAWLKACHEFGSKNLIGFDGEWINQSEMLDKKIEFKSVDLNSKFTIDEKVDLTISLEVAEHLKYESSEQFIECLTKTSETILFSAAYTNQGGTDHINENKHSYWASIFAKYDYKPFDLFRPKFWGDARVGFWFRQNTFLYIKKDTALFKKFERDDIKEIYNLNFMDCIHPELYENKCGEGLGFMLHAKNIIPSFFKAVRKKFNKN
jgi:SAM-dependent methyltransferase